MRSKLQRFFVPIITCISSLSYIKKSIKEILKCNRVYYTAVELCAHILCIFIPAHATVLRDRNPGVLNSALSLNNNLSVIIPDRCIAGGCSNTHKDEVSLHKWPEDTHFAKIWTNAVKNTGPQPDVFNPLTLR